MIVCVHLRPWDGESWVCFVDMEKLHEAISKQGLKRQDTNEEEIFEKHILLALKNKKGQGGDMPWLFDLFTEDDVDHFIVKKYPIQVDRFVSLHVVS